MGPHGIPGPLLDRSALVGLVLRSSLRAVLSARAHLPDLTEQERLSTAGRTGLVLVGEGEPYGRAEITRALGVGVHAVVARDPASAEHLSDGRPRPRKFDTSPLVRSLRTAAAALAARLERSEEVLVPVSLDESLSERSGDAAATPLDAVPLLAEAAPDGAEVSSRTAATRRALASYGVFRRDELRAATLDLPAPDLDWSQVVLLRRRASEEITEEGEQQRRSTGSVLTGDDRLLMGRAVIRRVVADHVRSLHRDGAGALVTQPGAGLRGRRWRTPSSATAGCSRCCRCPTWRTSRSTAGTPSSSSTATVGVSGCRRSPTATRSWSRPSASSGQNGEPSRPFDDTHPTMTLALGERFRLHAIGFGLSYRPSVVIRQHTLTDVSLADLADGGLMPRRGGASSSTPRSWPASSMVISGDQGAGKTTLLRALINAIPRERALRHAGDRLRADDAPASPAGRTSWPCRPGSATARRAAARAVGEFSVADLMPEALRQNLSRLVVGEVRGSEAAAMFEAMQAGTGTLSTTHSHSADSTIDRLASRVAQGGVLTVEEAYRQIAHNIHLFVYVRLVDDTWRGGTRRRFVSEIRQVIRAIENGRPVTHLTYAAAGTPGRPAGFFPDADFEAELLPFRRELPRCPGRPGRRSAVNAVAAVLAGLLITGGLWALVAGLRRREEVPRPLRRRDRPRTGGPADPAPARTAGTPARPARCSAACWPGSCWPRSAAGWSAVVVVPGLVLGLPYLLADAEAA